MEMMKVLSVILNGRIPLHKKMIPLFRRGWIRTLITPFLTVPRNKAYIFILGCYSSGTTLLNYLLGYHHEISALSTEGASITGELLTPEELGWARMIHPCLPEIQSHLDKIDVEQLKKDWGFFHDKSKPIYLEKSISNWARIEWLLKHFDNGWFIWIIRNGYAVAEGLRRRSVESIRYTAKSYPNGFPIGLCAKEWVVSNSMIESHLTTNENHIPIRYEDLTEKLEDMMIDILERLPVKDKTIKIPNSFEFHGKSRAIKNMNTQSIAQLSEQDIENINRVAGNYLIKWEYPLLGSRRDFL